MLAMFQSHHVQPNPNNTTRCTAIEGPSAKGKLHLLICIFVGGGALGHEASKLLDIPVLLQASPGYVRATQAPSLALSFSLSMQLPDESLGARLASQSSAPGAGRGTVVIRRRVGTKASTIKRAIPSAQGCVPSARDCSLS